MLKFKSLRWTFPLLFIANIEAMEQFIKARHDFVCGNYQPCLDDMSSLATNQVASKKIAGDFIYVFFPVIKKEKDSVTVSSQNLIDTPRVLRGEEKKSLSLAASARGRYLLERGKIDLARKWLILSFELDNTNSDARCYLQDTETKEEIVHSVYPVFEDFEL